MQPGKWMKTISLHKLRRDGGGWGFGSGPSASPEQPIQKKSSSLAAKSGCSRPPYAHQQIVQRRAGLLGCGKRGRSELPKAPATLRRPQSNEGGSRERASRHSHPNERRWNQTRHPRSLNFEDYEQANHRNPHHPQSQGQIDAVGFNGPDCELTTAFLEEALGVVGAKQKKPEFHQRQIAKHLQKLGG